jgi:hypothetical protein
MFIKGNSGTWKRRQNLSETEPASIRFYPESGVMIDGILTVVGFKANGKGGTPVDVTGLIKTDDGTTITSFSSNHDGIGKLQFKPKAGKIILPKLKLLAA